MQRGRTLPTGILLLGVLSAVFGYEDIESTAIESATLEKTCQEYPELFGCEHRNSDGKARRKRTVEEAESVPSPFYSLEDEDDADSDNYLEKRFSSYRIRYPETEGYKRGPGFRSWGGKRGGKGNKFSNWGGKRAEGYKGNKFSNWGGKRSFEEEPSDPFLEDKRAKFGSWGGKRSGEEDFLFDSDDKRAKFASWGGKRDYDSLFDEEKRAKFGSWGGKRDFEEAKRAKFGSWGGKRTVLFPDFQEDKRAKFGSWGGKRSDFDSDPEKRAKFGSWGGKRSDVDYEAEKRAKFSSWGGKRDDADFDFDKRAKFGSWGGKRFDTEDSAEKRDLEYALPYDDSETEEISKRPRFANPEWKRATFRSWGGKRAVFGSAGQKNPFYYIRRGDLRKFLNWGGKRKFSSWGGKRSAPEEDNSFSDLEKRPSFNSWGGKRSETNSSEIPLIQNLANESNNSADENATKEMAALSHINPYYPIVNKRSYYPGRQSSIKTLLLNDVYDTRGTDFGPRRRSEFFPWGGKRDENKTLR